MSKVSFPLSKVYGLLEPGPVVLVTTAKVGRTNIMTLSWHTMLEFEPPLVGCVISNGNFSFGILMATRECVINIPTVELAKQVGDCGNSSGRSISSMRLVSRRWSPHASRRHLSTNAMPILNAKSLISR